MLTAREAADYLGLDGRNCKHPDRSVNRLRKLGRFKGVRMGGGWMYRIEDLDKYIEDNQE